MAAPDADQFVNLMNKMSAKQDKEFQMTNEEGEKMLAAFKKKEFRDMFQEYMQEISDPKNRAEYEAHLKQLEADSKVPADKELLKPLAGFCVKTTYTDDSRPGEAATKLFINICHHEKLDPPSVKRSDKGQHWSLPNSLGPPRMEHDNKKSPTVTFDVVFHTEALTTAARSKQFKKMICEVAIEQVESKMRQYQQRKVTLNREYHILKKVACIGGTPAIMTLGKTKAPAGPAEPEPAQAAPVTRAERRKAERKAAKAGAKQKQEAGSSSSSTPAVAAAAPAPSQAKAAPAKAKAAKTKAAKAKAAKVKKVASEPPQPPLPEGVEVPRYTVVHRGNFELGDFTLQRNVASKRPRELVVRIELPRCKSVKRVALDVEPRALVLDAPKKYRLRLKLPFEVRDEAAAAKFAKDKRMLEVTLPVVPPPAPKAKPFQEPAAAVQEVSDDDVTDAGNGNEGGVPPAAGEATADSGEATAAATAGSHSRWVQPAKPRSAAAAAVDKSKPLVAKTPAPSLSPATPAVGAGSSDAGRIAVELPKPPQQPAHTWQQTATGVSVLLHVPSVLPSTVKVNPSAKLVEVLFSDAGSVDYRFAFAPCAGIKTAGVSADASAVNVVLMVPKLESGAWETLGEVQENNQAQPARAAFIASGKYSGRRAGYVFKSGDSGLGYYWDTVTQGPLAAATVAPGSATIAGGEASGEAVVELGDDGSFDISSAKAKEPVRPPPAPRASAKVVTHATGNAKSSPAQPMKPHPITGTGQLPGRGAPTAGKLAADMSRVNLQSTAMLEID